MNSYNEYTGLALRLLNAKSGEKVGKLLTKRMGLRTIPSETATRESTGNRRRFLAVYDNRCTLTPI